MRRLLLFVFVPVLLAGCVKSEVTRFHSGFDFGPGQTFVIYPSESQKDSLLFENVATDIAEHLSILGMRRLSVDADKADLFVTFSHTVDGGRTVVSSSDVYGQTGGGTTYHSGTISSPHGYGSSSYSGTSYQTPTYGVVGTSVISGVVYTREFWLDITDIRNAENPIKIFEGRLKSRGTDNSFERVRKCLVNAMFDGFPGISGKTETVRLNADCRS